MKYLFLLLSLSLTLLTSAQSTEVFVDVGAHQLFFKVFPGKGTPILFEAGNGDDSSVWEPVVERIRDSIAAPVIIYDRAGLGKSELDSTNISFLQEIRDLEKGLRKLGYRREVFLVNHSFGAFYNTLFAYRNRRKISGAVFIDPALPCFFTPDWSAGFMASVLPEQWALLRSHRQGLYHVLQHLDDICLFMQKRQLPREIPLTVIAAQRLLPMVQEEEEEQWRQCLQEFGDAPNHSYVLAAQSGHKVWEQELDLVVNTIISQYLASN